MGPPDEIFVALYPDCDNPVAYQNVPVSRTDIDQSDGTQLLWVKYVRSDEKQPD